MYTLFIGAPPRAMSRHDLRETVIAAAMVLFEEGLTLTDAVGVYKGRREDVLMLMVATAHPEKVRRLAQTLQDLLQQETIGLQVDGRYFDWHQLPSDTPQQKTRLQP